MKRRREKRDIVLKPDIPYDFTVIQLRTDFSLVRNLYLEADRLYDGRVEVLTDKIIRDYMSSHNGNRRLTTYIGYSSAYVYNVRLKVNTKTDLEVFCTQFECGVYMSEVAKAALYQWELNLRDRYEGYYKGKNKSRLRD